MSPVSLRVPTHQPCDAQRRTVAQGRVQGEASRLVEEVAAGARYPASVEADERCRGNGLQQPVTPCNALAPDSCVDKAVMPACCREYERAVLTAAVCGARTDQRRQRISREGQGPNQAGR